MQGLCTAAYRKSYSKGPKFRYQCQPSASVVLRRSVIALIDFYQIISKHWMRRCVFTPSCSVYAKTAFLEHSLPRAFYLVLSRLLRCNPMRQHPYDPVPYPGDTCEYDSKS